MAHRGFFQWLDHTECGPMPYDGIVCHLSKTPGALRRPQALVGEHNREILREILGLGGRRNRGPGRRGRPGDLVAGWRITT